jgi:hypothetical protein
MVRQRIGRQMSAMIRRRHMLALALAAAFAPAAALSPAVANAAGEQKKKGGGLSFIQFDTLTATVIRGDGRRGVMTVDIGVDVPNAALHQRAIISTPRLRAAYVQMLQAYASGLGAGVPPNADYMAQVLQRQTDAVLGQPGAKFLLGAIMVN